MTLALQITNNATGSLDAGNSDSATALAVKAGEGALFPTTAGANYFYVTIQADTGAWEIVKVTVRATDNFSTIERNIDSSTGAAQAFSADDIVTLRPIAEVIMDLQTELNLMNPTNTLTAPAGTKMIFYQNAAPAGWTIDSDPADHLLAIKGGTEAYNAAGGTKAGTWTQPDHNHTGPSHIHTMPTHIHTMPTHIHTMPSHIHTMGSHVHSTPSHILTIAEMPAHTHTEDLASATTSTTVYTPLRGKTDTGQNMTTSSVGGGNAHAHGNTGSTDPGDTSNKDPGDTNATDPGDTNAKDPGDTNASGTANTSSEATAATYRPRAALCIVATKD